MGRIRRTPSEPTAPGSDLGLPTPAMGAAVPSATPRARPRSDQRRRAIRPAGLIAMAVLLLSTAGSSRVSAQSDRLPDGNIAEIRFEGNATITADKIKPKLLSRVGQPLDQDRRSRPTSRP